MTLHADCGSSNSLLRVNLSAGYGSRTILQNISFDLNPGQSLGLVGTSGAGKSTLVLALLGLLPWRGGWSRGEVLFRGQNLLAMREREVRRLRGKQIALVPQSPMSALNSSLSLRSHFEAAWKAHDPRGLKSLDDRLEEIFPSVHLPLDRAFLKSRPGAISVGQAQRIMIALALLHRPAILVADEPTSALDPVTQQEILKLLRNLTQKAGTALLYISHDLLSVFSICDEVAVLGDGTMVERLPIPELGKRAHHLALAALLRALPVPPQLLLSYREQEAVSHASREEQNAESVYGVAVDNESVIKHRLEMETCCATTEKAHVRLI